MLKDLEDGKTNCGKLRKRFCRLMLKSKYRLKKAKQFKLTYSKGKSVVGRHMVIYWLLNQASEQKIGFSVSKKIGKAVVRNRYKRLLRACMMNYLDKLKPAHIIVIARARIVGSTYRELEREMGYLLKKAKLFK